MHFTLSDYKRNLPMRRYLTEFIGTFFLVLTIGLTIVGGSAFAPLAIGSVLMVMVYMGGHLSGAHYNPAVTLGVFLRGKMDGRDVAPYMIVQVLGALLAGGAVYVIMGETFAPTPGDSASLSAALLVEFLFSFALVLVILNTAATEETDGNSYFGLAIGFTLAVGIFAGGSVSGGAFNPAVSIGPAVVDTLNGAGSYSFIWIYVISPFAGGAVAALVSAVQHGQLRSAKASSPSKTQAQAAAKTA
jgi:aquaporin Z